MARFGMLFVDFKSGFSLSGVVIYRGPCLSKPAAPFLWAPAGTEIGYHSRFSRLTVSVWRSQMAMFQLVTQLAIPHER